MSDDLASGSGRGSEHPVLKTVVEDDKVVKQSENLTGSAKKGYEKIKELLSQGLPGLAR